MSSHHTQQLSDPNYLLRLQNLRLNDDGSANVLQVAHRRTSSLNGAAEHEPKMPVIGNRMPTTDDDYKLYDQNKFITASKLTGPKTQSPKHQVNIAKATAAGYRNSSSPTHSIGAISQQSVYENIDYYNPSIPVTQQPLPPPPPAYSHYVSNISKSNIGCGTYEVIGNKIQSNGNSLNRFTHTPQPDDHDPSHIYENLGNVSSKLFFFAALTFIWTVSMTLLVNQFMFQFYPKLHHVHHRIFHRHCQPNRNNRFTHKLVIHPEHMCNHNRFCHQIIDNNRSHR